MNVRIRVRAYVYVCVRAYVCVCSRQTSFSVEEVRLQEDPLLLLRSVV